MYNTIKIMILIIKLLFFLFFLINIHFSKPIDENKELFETEDSAEYNWFEKQSDYFEAKNPIWQPNKEDNVLTPLDKLFRRHYDVINRMVVKRPAWTRSRVQK
jgi:hypothetical protein